jgi:hypothetical protein
MIKDQQKRNKIARDWAAVRAFCKGTHRQSIAGGGFGPVFVNETPLDSFYNLAFVLAYAVLDRVLDDLRAQTVFSTKQKYPGLNAKMKASQTKLPWQNYSLIQLGRCVRNKVAHEAVLADGAQCFRFIDAIEAELRVWGILQ